MGPLVGYGTVSEHSHANQKFKGSFGVLSLTQHVPLHGNIKVTRRPHILGGFLNCLDWGSGCNITDQAAGRKHVSASHFRVKVLVAKPGSTAHSCSQFVLSDTLCFRSSSQLFSAPWDFLLLRGSRFTLCALRGRWQLGSAYWADPV